jgi:hypothetical protein
MLRWEQRGMGFWKDYMCEVFWAFWRALERTDTLIVLVIICAGISSLWLGGHAEHPSWQIVLTIFLVSLFILLIKMPYRLYAEQRAAIHSLNQRLIPKIKLSFHPNAEGLAPTPITVSYGRFGSPQIGTKELKATYVRIRAEVFSETTVTDCKAFLTNLQREHADGKTVSKIALPHSLNLKGGQPFDVHPKVLHTIDFLMCSSEDNKLVVPESDWPQSLRDSFNETGTYHFTITVNAGGISDSITVAVGWPGQWDKLIARRI